MMIRRWWEPRKINLESVLKSIGILAAGVAAVLAMVIVFGDRAEDSHTIDRLEHDVDRLHGEVGRLENQVDDNRAVTDCRSLLALDVTFTTANELQAIGHLVVVLTQPDREVIAGGITDLDTANAALAQAIHTRQAYEQDATDTCPITAEELLP